MDQELRRDCINAIYELYPIGRKLMYEAFDKLEDELTRTQQIILVVLSVSEALSMSQLADRICTSNEQATRAVTQLVEKGLVDRTQNKANRRVVNIRLTEKAKAYVELTKDNMLAGTDQRARKLTDRDLEKIRKSILEVINIYNKINDV